MVELIGCWKCQLCVSKCTTCCCPITSYHFDNKPCGTLCVCVCTCPCAYTGVCAGVHYSHIRNGWVLDWPPKYTNTLIVQQMCFLDCVWYKVAGCGNGGIWLPYICTGSWTLPNAHTHNQIQYVQTGSPNQAFDQDWNDTIVQFTCITHRPCYST